MKTEQTQLTILFNGAELSKVQLDKIETRISQVISHELNAHSKLRDYAIIRDVRKHLPKFFPKPFPRGIVIDFRHNLLGKYNDNFNVK